MKQLIEQDIRCLSLSLIQRGGSPIAFDRLLASNYGSLGGEIASEEPKESIVNELTHTQVIQTVNVSQSSDYLCIQNEGDEYRTCYPNE